MMNRLILFSITASLLVACANKAPELPIPGIDGSGTNEGASASQTLVPTRQSLDTTGATTSPTFAVFSPHFTPTFDASSVVTATLAPAADCRALEKVPTPEILARDAVQGLIPTDFGAPILDFLRSGGSMEAVRNALAQAGWLDSDRTSFLQEDVTGDGVDELILSVGNAHVYGCICNTYRSLLSTDLQFQSLWDSWLSILSTADMNLNGIPEIVLASYTCNGACLDVYILEWDGQGMSSLIRSDAHAIYRYKPSVQEEFVEYADLVGTNEAEIVDIESNGTLELVLRGGIPTNLDRYTEGPWRTETIIYMWNGQNFVFDQSYFDLPQFRFQAVQDGDLSSFRGDYQAARAFYDQVIHSEELDWWSPEREDEMIAAFVEGRTPTPHAPNDDEYFQLASYASFRIVLLHVLEGDMAAAEGALREMQSTFPVGNPGHAYVELASTFWDHLVESRDMGAACHAAIDYVTLHPGIIEPLGSIYHGLQSHYYTPEDVCPFY